MTLRKVSDSNGQSPVVLVNLVNFTKQSVFLFQPHWTLQHQRVETVFTHSFARESDFKMHSVRYYRVNYGIPPHIYIYVYIYVYVNMKIYLYTLNMYIVCILYVNICSIQLLNIYIPIQGYASKFLLWNIWTLEALVWHTWSVSWANGMLEGLQEVAKETSSKSQLPAGVGGVHLLDCGYMGSPTDWIPTYCVFHLSAPRNITYQTMMR